MLEFMKAYLDLLQRIMDDGEDKADRTGTGTRSIFGEQLRFDLRQGFPLVTTKKIYFDSVLRELLWFIRIPLVVFCCFLRSRIDWFS